MIFAVALVLILSDPKLPPGVTCEIIRDRVAQYGYARSLIWARSNGYSWVQIREARKCLK